MLAEKSLDFNRFDESYTQPNDKIRQKAYDFATMDIKETNMEDLDEAFIRTQITELCEKFESDSLEKAHVDSKNRRTGHGRRTRQAQKIKEPMFY